MFAHVNEMPDANNASMETEESASAASTTTTTPVVSPSPPAEATATWSFVQMNMSLLPIARPLPVATVCHRFQESFQTGKKPRTPNQKLHRRVLQNASNISPRRHDLGGTVRRVSNAGLFGVSSASLPPPPRQPHDQLRISVPSANASPSSSLSPSLTLSSMDASAAIRVRSQSEEIAVHRVKNKRACDDTSGYASDSCDSAVVPPRGALLLSRSVSLSAAADSKAYKGKRIMELLDEERRLHPDERSTAQSPTKRSRHQ